MNTPPTFKGNWTPPKTMELGLRDYFAAMAMQGMLSNPHHYQVSYEHIFAREAYMLADAMMKAREAS